MNQRLNTDFPAGVQRISQDVFLCLTVDPNKERREAVKRKTTQYLKRAEEIFITHLQDNLGKGSSHLGVRHRLLLQNDILLG